MGIEPGTSGSIARNYHETTEAVEVHIPLLIIAATYSSVVTDISQFGRHANDVT
jgi:hypothetical protein